MDFIVINYNYHQIHYYLINNFIANFAKYVEYAKSLKFSEEPDYSYLQNLFVGVLQDENLPQDFNYEWLLSSKITNDKNGNIIEDEEVKYYNN